MTNDDKNFFREKILERIEEIAQDIFDDNMVILDKSMGEDTVCIVCDADEKVCEKYPDYRILILPDHPTPLSLRTHTSEPVPFLIYQKSDEIDSGRNGYDEFQAKESGIMINDGYTLMDSFIKLKSLNEL